MSASDLERRLRRLEAARGDADEQLIEHEVSAEGQQLLREILEGLHEPAEIERIVTARRVGRRAQMSEEGRRQFEDVLDALRGPVPGHRVGSDMP